jgi:hypothetical protein
MRPAPMIETPGFFRPSWPAARERERGRDSCSFFFIKEK